jgi:hypothetical protein
MVETNFLTSVLIVVLAFLAGAWVGRTILSWLRALLLGKIGKCASCPDKITDSTIKDS